MIINSFIKQQCQCLNPTVTPKPWPATAQHTPRDKGFIITKVKFVHIYVHTYVCMIIHKFHNKFDQHQTFHEWKNHMVF